MTDRYLTLVNSGVTATVAKRLGLPRPAVLRRYAPGDPLVPEPLLVVNDPASAADADALTDRLVDWGLDVRRHGGREDRFGAILLVLTGVTSPADLGDPALAIGGTLRGLARGGRVVAVSRPAAGAGTDAATAAARRGVEGIVRSLAKELRGGATGNGIVVDDGVPVSAPSVIGGLRFLLSGRSAFVDGQLVAVTSGGGELPGDWDRTLADQVAVVTGAARGIGAAIARTLARDGAEVIAVDVPAAGDALATVANEIHGTALQLDVTADEAAARLLAHARSRHGRLDVVVHNAGITRDKLLANMSREKWDPVLGVNVLAPLRITEALLEADGLGAAPRIIGVASTSGIAGNRGQTNYAASKAGVLGMVAAWAPELARRGGTINAVAPGFIETEMTAHMPTLTRQVARRLSSLQQGGQPQDVAEAIAFLASPQAAGINGEVLRVCGQNLVGA